jgi:uncharacterized protein
MGNPFVHVELMASDLEKSKDFYQSLFDWKLEEVPGANYTMINVGQGTGGGMMKHPMDGAPSQWIAYVEVDDVVAATEKAKSLRAAIIKPVTHVAAGSFSIITDPNGAMLGLWQPKEKTK